MSYKNTPNVVIDMDIIELVVRAGLFEPSNITIITPYKEQAALIRQALLGPKTYTPVDPPGPRSHLPALVARKARCSR